jgi:hypothetical protein
MLFAAHGSTFRIFSGKVADLELRLKVEILGGNSAGIVVFKARNPGLAAFRFLTSSDPVCGILEASSLKAITGRRNDYRSGVRHPSSVAGNR